MKTNHIYLGDALEVIQSFPDKSIDTVITSPPYWQLRDYGWDGQWGLESDFETYLERMWSLMDEFWRVLKDQGTVWINLGDSYNARHGQAENTKIYPSARIGNTKKGKQRRSVSKALPDKCQLLIPHRFAIGCIERGWILRNDIIWAKRNGMPESVTDRFSKKHEFLFFMVKQPRYYFDLEAILELKKRESILRAQRAVGSYQGKQGHPVNNCSNDKTRKVRTGKNPGDVADFWQGYAPPTLEEFLALCEAYYFSPEEFWDIPVKASDNGHYASFNFSLIEKPILAGCPEDGIVLDPFCGSGTTRVRALQLGRRFIGIDGSKKYVKAARRALEAELTQTKLF
ncbi:MAG: site-specific DNA-methyltransferase [Bacteroidota bacterium]